MATASPEVVATPTGTPQAKGSKKKLIVIALAVMLLFAAGVGVALYLRSKAAHAVEAHGEDEAGPAIPGLKQPDPSHPPVFLPLDNFVVNLADHEGERFAQIGVTLEIEDAKAADLLKLYMPAIRNGILMVIAHKTSSELLDRAGKEFLAAEIRREAVRPLGIDLAMPARADSTIKAEADGAVAKPAKERAQPTSPVKQVHFSTFIIQ
jgi:flagellar FliL protein